MTSSHDIVWISLGENCCWSVLGLKRLITRKSWSCTSTGDREKNWLADDCDYNHGQKSWDTFAFLGHFPIHTGPTPPLTPQTMLDACIQNFFRVSTLYRVEGGRTARKFRKGCTVLRGNREMTEKYEYCSTVPRTFVQDCRMDTLKSGLTRYFSWNFCLKVIVLGYTATPC